MAISSVQQNPNRHWTADEVRALPDDGMRYEVVNGKLLVSPAPRQRHQHVLRDLLVTLVNYLQPLGLAHTVLSSPADISWASDVLVQPDLFVVPPQEITGRWEDIKTLLLAIEILSPGTRRNDEWTKRLLYQKYGVAEYWVVDADAATVDVWHPDDTVPRTVTDQLTWRTPFAKTDCVIDLARVFA